MDAQKLLRELEETAAWIEEQGTILRELAAKKSSVAKQLGVAAAQCEGRAVVIRLALEQQKQSRTEAATGRRCETCDVLIPEERLELLPDTLVCVRCAAEDRSDRGRNLRGPHR